MKQSISVPALVLAIALANIPKSIALASRPHSPQSQSSNLIAAAPSSEAAPSESDQAESTHSQSDYAESDQAESAAGESTYKESTSGESTYKESTSGESAYGETIVTIHSSTSMTGINEVLEQRFEHEFAGSKVEVDYTSTDAALSALQQGNVDLAAVGRTLTSDEIAQGLVQVPMSRRKIAVVIGEDNPFEGSLTIEQFAKIFRGEITDWVEVGGEPGPIRFIDRSETSYARHALPTYGVFKDGPFITGENAIQLAHDTPEAMIQAMLEALGKDGISYAIAAQVFERPGVKLVEMHQSLPNDAEYPFSKLLSYVYQGPTPNPAVQKYLTFAADPINKGMIETARRGGAISSEHGVPSLQAAYLDLASSSSSARAYQESAPYAGGKDSYADGKYAEGKAGGSYGSEKAVSPTGLFPWWRWFILVPISGIFLWSLVSRSPSEVDDA
ncbi:MAG: substrate-binding domain-containing protein [Leptolyngbyaceae cyanobacterium MO_188.B28]|nr:substrate-binding domain-containing protein [Leptolyngbyaceae cyanobacterium MO_188.B28]